MLVPDPWRERVQLRFVQVEPKFDGPGLDQLTVRVIVPLKHVADTVGSQRCAVVLPEFFYNIAVRIECFHGD